MIFLVKNERREADLFIDKEGVDLLLNILKGYENLTENDHDHIQFVDGLVSTNIVEGYDFDGNQMADEITIRFRHKLKLKK